MPRKMKYETTQEIEVAVAEWFDWRTHIIVPNVSWGLFLGHECDMLAVTKAGVAHEVEIKISKSDLKADMLKRHNHRSNRIKYLWFAVPQKIGDVLCLYAPARAGLLIVDPRGRISILREAVANGDPRMPGSDIFNLARLGTMRIWTLSQSAVSAWNNYRSLHKMYEELRCRSASPGTTGQGV